MSIQDSRIDYENIKSIDFDATDMKVIRHGGKLDINVNDYIAVYSNEYLDFYLTLIQYFNYLIFDHVYRFAEANFNRSKTSAYNDIKKLENLGYIKLCNLSGRLYAMLSKKGAQYLAEYNDVSERRSPSTENLYESLYLAEYVLQTYGGKGIGGVIWPKNSLICLETYDYLISLYNTLKEGYCAEISIDTTENIRDFIENFDIGFIKNEYILINSYLWKDPIERRNSKVDFLWGLRYSHIFVDKIEMLGDDTNYENDAAPLMRINISILDIDRDKKWFARQLLRIDNYIAYLHRMCLKQHISVHIKVLTYNQERANFVSSIFKDLMTKMTKHKKDIFINSKHLDKKFNEEIYKIHRNNKNDSIYYIEEPIEVINMNILKYLIPKNDAEQEEPLHSIIEKGL